MNEVRNQTEADFKSSKIESFERDAKCSDRRQSSKSPHKNLVLIGFGKSRF
jgi:hypothetical protein